MRNEWKKKSQDQALLAQGARETPTYAATKYVQGTNQPSII